MTVMTSILFVYAVSGSGSSLGTPAGSQTRPQMLYTPGQAGERRPDG